MGIRQLEEFLGQADQKGFWVFSYANLGGGFFGAFLGNSLLDRLAPSLKLLGIILGALLGVLVTWKVKGHPIYRWVLSSALFLLRRYLKVGLGEFTIDAGRYYRSRAVTQEPFMIVATRDGRPVPVLVHRGSGPGARFNLFDDPLPPAREQGEWRSAAGVGSAGPSGSAIDPRLHADPAARNGHSPAHARHSAHEVDQDPNLDYSGWDL